MVLLRLNKKEDAAAEVSVGLNGYKFFRLEIS